MNKTDEKQQNSTTIDSRILKALEKIENLNEKETIQPIKETKNNENFKFLQLETKTQVNKLIVLLKTLK